MLITKNPSDEKIKWLVEQSDVKFANWLQDLEDGDFYYWPAGWTSHTQMAQRLQISAFEKGVSTG